MDMKVLYIFQVSSRDLVSFDISCLVRLVSESQMGILSFDVN
jgi:hypothetical protein